MEVEVGGCFLCLGVKTPVGQAEMTADSYTTPDLREDGNEKTKSKDNQRDSTGRLVADGRRGRSQGVNG